MSNLEIIVLILSPFFAALLTSVIGFGSGLLLIPIYSIYLPVSHVIGFTSILFLFTTLSKIFFYYRSIKIKEYIKIFVISLPGLFLGIWFVSFIDNNILTKFVALYILFIVLFDVKKDLNTSLFDNIMPVSVTAGFASAISHGAGPILTLFFNKRFKDRMSTVATIAILNFSWNIIKSLSFNRFNLIDPQLTVKILPFAVLLIFPGAFLGKRILVNYVDEKRFKILTESIIIILALKMLIF